jgi:hypothetical protein
VGRAPTTLEVRHYRRKNQTAWRIGRYSPHFAMFGVLYTTHRLPAAQVIATPNNKTNSHAAGEKSTAPPDKLSDNVPTATGLQAPATGLDRSNQVNRQRAELGAFSVRTRTCAGGVQEALLCQVDCLACECGCLTVKPLLRGDCCWIRTAPAFARLAGMPFPAYRTRIESPNKSQRCALHQYRT